MEWYLLLGISNGARTMTAIAVVCWASWLHVLPQNGWAAWTGHPVSVIVFTIMAVGEWYGDTRPGIGNRTDLAQLLSRLAFGGLAGALAAHCIEEPVIGGVLFAWIGVLIGAFGGLRLRLGAARRFGNDRPVALCESALALGLAVLSAWELHKIVLTSR